MSASKFVLAVKDAEHWKQILEENVDKLIVVNVHKAWSGPCTIMEPTLKRVHLDTEDADKRLLFVSLPTDLQLEEIPPLESCKPLFLLYRDNAIVETIVGANAPQLESKIQLHTPAYDPTDPTM